MSRYERSSGPTRLYVGRLSRHVRSRDLEDMFGKYGRVRAVDMKYDFAFVDFGDHQDADDARHYLNGREVSGNRIIVEFAKGAPRGGGGGGGGSSREYLGRGPPPGTGRCYNCGNDGHWARDCKAGDWKNKCYKCGQRGHIERDCRGSAKVSSRHDDRDGSRSRSRSRSREKEGGEHQGRSYYGRERSYSRSPPKRGRSRSSSPPPRKASGNNRSPDTSPPSERRRLESQSQSRSLSRSPVRTKGSPPLGSRSRSRSPSENGQNSASLSPRNMSRSRSRSRSRSPLSDEPQSPNGVDHGPLTDEADLQRSPNGVDRDSSRSDD